MIYYLYKLEQIKNPFKGDWKIELNKKTTIYYLIFAMIFNLLNHIF